VEATVTPVEDAAMLLPALIGRALGANDGAKYYFALLQSAGAQADDPAVSFSSLRDERVSARIADRRWDHVVEDAQCVGSDLHWMPGVAAAHAELVDAIAEMLNPLRLTGADESVDVRRFDALMLAAPDLDGDRVSGAGG
jgi:hypothetical protein